jgi:plastocyanin
MLRKVLFIVLILVGAIVASGCTTTTNTTPNPAPVNTTTQTPAPVNQNPQTYTINIQNNTFNPSSMQILVGDTVKWVNLDSVQHEPKGRVFDSGSLGQNNTFEYTFNNSGNYVYQCAIHPSMLGTIKVV